MSIVYEEKAMELLETMQMTTASEVLDQIAQKAASEQWSYSHFLGVLLEREQTARHKKKVAIAYNMARFPYLKKLEDYEFDAQPSVDRQIVDELATGRYYSEGRNIVFLGPPGVGKTHLSVALGSKVVENGKRVYFTTAVDMVRRLNKALDENRLHRVMNTYLHPTLLIIDEVGYLQLDKAEASLLFQVICKRYDRQQSIIMTSNKAFSEWGDIFANDPVMASAALDRIMHRSTVINIKGESYRLKEKRRAGMNMDINEKKHKEDNLTK